MDNRMNHVYKKRGNCEVTDLGEGCIMIYNVDSKETHLLNQVMTYLFQMCDGVRCVEKIIDELCIMLEDSEIPMEQTKRECTEGFVLMNEKNILMHVSD